jgi:pimeloyl-ACP methyl ester carboxylesterase
VKVLFYKNTAVHYIDIGKGAAVVLLHGFLENQSMWNHFIPELSQKNRVITIDLLGHGATGCLGYVHTMELGKLFLLDIQWVVMWLWLLLNCFPSL